MSEICQKINLMKYLKFKSSLLAVAIGSLVFISCGDDEDDKNEPNPVTQQNQTNNPSLPASISGKVVNFIFTVPQTGAPYNLNQEVAVTFSSSGMFFLDENPIAKDGDEVSVTTFTEKGKEIVWDDTANDYSYALSFKSNDSTLINELNVTKTSTSEFLGSFQPIQPVDASVLKNFTGSKNVVSVGAGTHSRRTVIIDAEGNVDFDTNVQLNVADIRRIDDVIGGSISQITLFMKPFPATPYQRLTIIADTSRTTMQNINYRPEAPSSTNEVRVTL